MSLAKKLLLKPQMKIAIANEPDGYPALLGELPAGVELVSNPTPGSLDLLLFWVHSVAELERLAPELLPQVKHDGLLWIAYPKKSSKIKTDISRDAGWDVVKAAGLVGIALIALDETWSAMRFRPVERIGK